MKGKPQAEISQMSLDYGTMDKGYLNIPLSFTLFLTLVITLWTALSYMELLHVYSFVCRFTLTDC